jgi:hypothetical protein
MLRDYTTRLYNFLIMQHYDINISSSFWLLLILLLLRLRSKEEILRAGEGHYVSLPEISAQKREDVSEWRREKIKAIFIAHITSSGMRTFGGIIIYVANVLFTPLLLCELLSLPPPVRFFHPPRGTCPE